MTSNTSTAALKEALAFPLSNVNRSMLSKVGGKAANLGDMIQSKKTPLPVPPGFVLTSESYRLFLSCALRDSKGQLQKLFDELDALAQKSEQDDNNLLNEIRRIGSSVRAIMEKQKIPQEILDVITAEWAKLDKSHTGSNMAVAVRSSATAEDLPSSSFAGQQDTYLNIIGLESVIRHIRLCWSSLFTDRAIVYRVKNNFDHCKVFLCVVVQKQIDPVKSGIMFTADAISSKRSSIVIEAGYGLGEALVSGLINADQYKYDVKKQMLSEIIIGDQHIEIVPTFDAKGGIGGTVTIEVSKERRKEQKLSDKEIQALLKVGKDVQQHYNGVPQDIEWCFERHTDNLYVVQSRPITTLFPLPVYQATTSKGADDGLHVFSSVGHVQVMTDPIRPCGRSVFKHILSLGPNGSSVVTNAGAFLYVDMTKPLRVPTLRRIMLNGMKNASEALALSLENVVEREEFSKGATSSFRDTFSLIAAILARVIPMFSRVFWNLFFAWDLESASTRVTGRTNKDVQSFRGKLREAPNVQARLIVAREELRNLFNIIFKIGPYAVAGIAAFGIITKMLSEDETVDEDIDAARKGLNGNVTTEMDLAIGDLADVARQDREVTSWLEKGTKLNSDGLSQFKGTKFYDQFGIFMDQYGCRGNSEIDITRLRWKEDPTSILNVIRGNLSNAEMGHHRTHHRALQAKGNEAAKKLLEAAPWYKKPLVGRLLQVGRTLGALREHHKFLLIQIMWEVKQVILEAATELLSRGALESTDDIWFLDFDEIIQCFEWSNAQVLSLVHKRREEYEVQSKFKPPHVLTSDGECVNVQPNSGYVPPGALAGLAVSSGVVEGIAKVVTDPTYATLHSGEILVAPFTDPGWTPLFINASGLVMEVGGFLTHGSVVSREYGIPAVSCVQDATTKIQTGMRLRVDGRRGFVEILEEEGFTSAVA